MQILVTGGAGFIGSNLVADLIKDKKHEIVIFDNLSSGRSENVKKFQECDNVRLQIGDIQNTDDLDKLFKTKFDIIFHLSAIVGVSHYIVDPLKVIDVNVGGTRNILKYCLKNNSKLVFMSTSEIFGKNPKIPWRENDDRVLGSPQVARWSYSTSKAVCEHMISALSSQKKLNSVILRYFNVYGPWQNHNFIIPKTIFYCMNGVKPIIHNSGKQTRCFTYISDAIDATKRASFNDSISGEVFNIGNYVETTVKDAISIVLKETSNTPDFVEYVDTEKEIGSDFEDIPRRVPDVSKAKKILGWKAKTQLREGVKLTVEWVKANSWWLKKAPGEIRS